MIALLYVVELLIVAFIADYRCIVYNCTVNSCYIDVIHYICSHVDSTVKLITYVFFVVH